MRFFAEVSFKGTAYHGWQVQKNALSVQELINRAFSTVLRESIETLGCGRTDTGVHAKQLFAHFDTVSPVEEKQLIAVNCLLPKDIAIRRVFEVPAGTHARFDALSRSYAYHLCFHKDPFLTGFAWFIHEMPDMELMNRACSLLLEHEDFSCFSKSHTQVKTNLCRVMSAGWKAVNDELIFEITADRFLRNMVRAIVGTMLQVGRHELSLDGFVQVLESKNRSMAGMSVPAEGLYLCKVDYPQGKLFLNPA